jgi:phosphate starvation-inducible protein PhoH
MMISVKRPGGVRLKEPYLRPINDALKSRTRNAIPEFFVDMAILIIENYQNHYSKITTNVLLA